jgi:hypothetical protein
MGQTHTREIESRTGREAVSFTDPQRNHDRRLLDGHKPDARQHSVHFFELLSGQLRRAVNFSMLDRDQFLPEELGGFFTVLTAPNALVNST